ncbi:hypothetical protein BU14_0565s0008 [Porphyra umbilicalis]|uniref:Uncharacterized protein n=1 Tax=Porphyra umbilicalis TaxID=2786 RepID=A0A1X6NRR7_PORUM|nr:hypothetical protein BU14_0565s0008 [Porphyra umbilicalis]|eukprot:OSX71277.1 hypothetical protein BU14_0565s0008 [Porphyra umbilicalis]
MTWRGRRRLRPPPRRPPSRGWPNSAPRACASGAPPTTLRKWSKRTRTWRASRRGCSTKRRASRRRSSGGTTARRGGARRRRARRRWRWSRRAPRAPATPLRPSRRCARGGWRARPRRRRRRRRRWVPRARRKRASAMAGGGRAWRRASALTRTFPWSSSTLRSSARTPSLCPRAARGGVAAARPVGRRGAPRPATSTRGRTGGGGSRGQA